MAYVTRKRIKGKYYLYAIRSIRLPNGKIIKISKLIQKNSDFKSTALRELFNQKEIELLVQYARKYLEPFLPDTNSLYRVEQIKFDYKRIISGLSMHQLQDLFDRFTVNFTYESNALEGNSLTLKDVAIVIYENVSIKGKSLREIYETRNSRKVVDLIFKKKFSISERDVLKIHSFLVKDMDISKGYKKFPNYIQGRQVMTTMPEEVPAAMKKLFYWYEQKKNTMHPLQLAARFHGLFEQIHPFEDGNGRVGRFLINVILINAGYPPIIIRKTQRISYFNALEDSNDNRSRTLERFIFERFKETYENFFMIYVKYLKK